MIVSRKRTAIIPSGWSHLSVAVASSFLLCSMLGAQSAPPADAPMVLPVAPSVPFLLAKSPFADFVAARPSHAATHSVTAGSARPVSSSSAAAMPGMPRRITLEEAQQAAANNNPLARLGQLSVEAAHQHRLAAEGDYFPKIAATAENFHFNKFMGREITVQRPIAGGTATTGLPLLGKDQTLVSLTAAQPLTPIFKVQQGVAVARADERTAMAKAGMPVETADDVEKDYYDLLVAERELDMARANSDLLHSKRLVATTSAPPAAATEGESADDLMADKELILAQTKVKELTEALNSLLGLPADTELELVTPVTDREDISLKEATYDATTANPEVVAAEGDLVKARAGQRLAKLDYVPDIAVLGGYVYNANAAPLLPTDFSYIGVLGSWTVWDWGKREHTLKERNAQVGMAETAVALTKAKVAGAVKSSYFEMDRSRQLSELAHKLQEAVPLERTGYDKDNPELTTTRAKIEIEALQADLAYRKALASLKTLMGKQ
jgi:outer membrane protein TolC